MKTQIEQLKYGGHCEVPYDVALCPECGANLIARSQSWCVTDGTPSSNDLDLECMDANAWESHKWHQSDWQPIRNAVSEWCGARP